MVLKRGFLWVNQRTALDECCISLQCSFAAIPWRKSAHIGSNSRRPDPYGEFLNWRLPAFWIEVRSCRGRLPRLPARHDDQNANRAGTEACPYEWPSETREAIALFDGLNPFASPVRADTAVRPYAEFINGNHHSHFVTSVTSRCAVECGVGGPLAGLVSYRILQASTHSAAGRAGTIHDRNIRRSNPKSLHPPSGMVDPLGHQTVRPSPAEPNGHQNFALHPATSARTRCIYRASGQRVCGHPKSNETAKRAGGHSGPPLRGGLTSATHATFTKPSPSCAGGHIGTTRGFYIPDNGPRFNKCTSLSPIACSPAADKPFTERSSNACHTECRWL